MRVIPFVALSAIVAVMLVQACKSKRIETCGVLPDPTACPVERGGTCEDETCSALYGCFDTEWVLQESCEQMGTGGSPVGAGGSGGEGACNGVEIDRTGQSTNCSPPLQEPDCPAAAAELCRPCETVCVDFFLCRADGWVSVAFCDEDGNVFVEP